MHIYHHDIKVALELPVWDTHESMTDLQIRRLMTTPPSQLTPELAARQRRVMEIDGPMRELLDVPMEGLPRELQDLKRQAEMRRPPRIPEVEVRVNELLRENGEHELPFLELQRRLDYGDMTGVAKTKEQFMTRTLDLKRRKPQLSATGHRMMQAGMEEREARARHQSATGQP